MIGNVGGLVSDVSELLNDVSGLLSDIRESINNIINFFKQGPWQYNGLVL